MKRGVAYLRVSTLDQASEGLSLHGVTVVPEGLSFQIKADKDTVQSGFADNLIIEAVREYRPKDKSGKLLAKRRSSMGFLRAIPIEVVCISIKAYPYPIYRKSSLNLRLAEGLDLAEE